METRKNIFFAIAGLVTVGMLATITSGVALASDQDLSPTVTQISGTAEDTGQGSAVNKAIVLTDAEKYSIVEEFIAYGVNESTAWKLVEKYESGEMLDSMKSDVYPVSTVSEDEGDVIEVIRTYPDGSIAVETTSNLAGAKKESITDNSSALPKFRSVYGCTYTSGGNYAGYWKNCTADVNLVVVRMGFVFDYQSIRDAGSKITGYRSYFHHIFGGALSNFRFDRMSASQVRLSADLDIALRGFPAGWTARMQVNVNGTSAYTTHN